MSEDSDKKGERDSSGQGIIQTNQDVFHPAVGVVFRMDNILEKICSHLGFNDLKQFRLVSRICNNEGRRELIKRDGHWAVVQSKNDDWQLELGQVLTNLEEIASAGGENSNQKLRGWIFKRLELKAWEYCFGDPYFLQQWGHYLRKIHFKADLDDEAPIFGIYELINMIHQLLTVSCPNLDEMVVDAVNLEEKTLYTVIINQLESLEFPLPLLKLKCLRINRLWISLVSIEEREIVLKFLTKLLTASGIAIETLEIDCGSDLVERRMLVFLASNVGVSHFQSLKEITLLSADNVGHLSHTVQKCFPKITTLILRDFCNPILAIQPGCFPALKSLTIHDMIYENITNGRMLNFLQHFPNVEVLTIYSGEGGTNGLPGILEPITPLLKSLRSFTLKTEDYDLRLLRCAVDMFPNLVTLDLLGLGREVWTSLSETEYSFGELIDIISPLNCLQHLYVNHAFHTSTQLVDAIQLTSNFAALQTFLLSQAAHDYTEQDFNVSLYLTTSDPDFQYILDCDWVKRLKLVRLSAFRFGTTQEEVEEEAAAKGGHVSFGPICSCNVDPSKCCQQKRGIPCYNSGGRPIYHA